MAKKLLIGLVAAFLVGTGGILLIYKLIDPPIYGESTNPVYIKGVNNDSAMEDFPTDIQNKIIVDYPESKHKLVGDLLSNNYNDLEVTGYRIQRCMLYLANGELAELKKMDSLARVDWRDVILWAEYENDKQRYDFNQTFEQNGF